MYLRLPGLFIEIKIHLTRKQNRNNNCVDKMLPHKIIGGKKMGIFKAIPFETMSCMLIIRFILVYSFFANDLYLKLT